MARELYSSMQRSMGDVLRDIKTGRIGLPDLQRPFEWKDSKVRDLLDSMMKGFPIGYISVWRSPEEYETTKHIGRNEKNYDEPEELVIDGQQRLTGLLAAMYDVVVYDKEYEERVIQIAFNPISGQFDVWNAAIGKNPEWIDSVSEIFAAKKQGIMRDLREDYLDRVDESRKRSERTELSRDGRRAVEDNLNQVGNFEEYLLPTMCISGDADEESVSEIFVRLNSGGQKLNEKNFVETLLAVYDHSVREEINRFCQETRIPKDGTAYNHILKASPAHLIRMAVGLGFRRARLSYAYKLLRGKDLETGTVSEEERERNLAIFKESLEKVTDLANWHAFMNLFADAGYTSSGMVASKNAVVYSYVLYLLGKYDYKVPEIKLRNIIRRWIFVATVTRFYSGSVETEAEKQFADLRRVRTADEFVAYLETSISHHFTDDYFAVTLPSEFSSNSTQSPAWQGFVASQMVLDYAPLFGGMTLRHYLGTGASGHRKSLELHHVFPKGYLKKEGVHNKRERDQVANLAYVSDTVNKVISDKAPDVYAPDLRDKMRRGEYDKTCQQNAVPADFDELAYGEFIRQRQRLMAQTVHQAYERLCQSV